MDDTVAYDTIWETLGLDETRPLPFNETITVDSEDWSQTLRDLLPVVSVDRADSTASSSHFRIRSELGRGGMGIVQLATQRALGREVAIKTVLPERRSREVEDALLQEARVMGLVEHPNVVPVHIIGRDDDGKPIIVMKRIEGTSWAQLLKLDDPGTFLESLQQSGPIQMPNVAARLRAGDPLDFHLDILIKVAQAVAYSHSRGILHRDLKPENVMIGAFGEVYVLDWGLAVSLPGHDHPMLPRAVDANHVCGTPHYMAPEMTVGSGADLGIHTDIYLLGAILYEVLTGRPPHQGKTLFEVMRSSYEGRAREYPARIPDEIRGVTETAMARAPEERFSSAAELVEAIEEFRRHRSSHELASEAMGHLDQLREALNDQRTDVVAAYRTFGAARFGFEQALKVWGRNTTARTALEATLRAMVDFELRNDHPDAAAALLADLGEPAPDLEERLEALRKQHAERVEELEVLRAVSRDFDASVGLRVKAWMIVILGLGFLPLIAIPMYLRTLEDPPWAAFYIGASLAFFPVMLTITLLGWKTFQANVANRVLLVSLWLMWFYGSIIRIMTIATGAASYGGAIGAELLLFSLGAAMLSRVLYRRMIIPAVCFFAGALAAGIWPHYGFEIYGGASTVACFGFSIAVALSGES